MNPPAAISSPASDVTGTTAEITGDGAPISTGIALIPATIAAISMHRAARLVGMAKGRQRRRRQYRPVPPQ